MLFCTQKFLVFFLIVFTAYWVIPWARGRVWVLLAASYYFYASWNADLARLIFLTTVCDYLIARGMDATESQALRRFLVWLSVVGNLGVLCFFKYANFFIESLQMALEAAGASASFFLLRVILPIGISFYTFEAISYTVDVYQRRVAAERRLDHFLLFILFFPHLVAGPIVRARDFLPQVRRPKFLTWPRIAFGGRLILLGMFKKMVVADRMALLVDPVFADPARFDSIVVWMAVFGYTIQVYCDFSGYSDIALGTARLLGYRLVINFNMPLAAANISDFWRRWHISLSSWIRDYIYIPLGGNRGSPIRTALNLIFAMTLCGLWHGASWTFVAWGALNGVLLVMHRQFRLATQGMTALQAAMHSLPGTAFRIALTLTSFALVTVMFRSPTFATTVAVFEQLFVPTAGDGLPIPLPVYWTLVGAVLAAHLIAGRTNVDRLWERFPPVVRGLALALFLFITLVLSPELTAQFIYFQF